MMQLPNAIPDVEVLLDLTPEELGSKMLFLLRQWGQATFHPYNMSGELWGDTSRGHAGYPRNREAEIGLALAEVWAWLQAQGLVIPADGINGQNGWRRLSRRAQSMETAEDFTGFRVARLLPRELLHPKIAIPIWRAFMRRIRRVQSAASLRKISEEDAGFAPLLTMDRRLQEVRERP